MRDVAASEGVRASAAPPECRGGVASAASSQAPSSIDHLSLQEEGSALPRSSYVILIFLFWTMILTRGYSFSLTTPFGKLVSIGRTGSKRAPSHHRNARPLIH